MSLPAPTVQGGFFGTVPRPVRGPAKTEWAALTRWVRERVARAAAGQPELVRVQVFFKGHQGCTEKHPGYPPGVWIGGDGERFQDVTGMPRQGTWVDLVLPPGVKEPGRSPDGFQARGDDVAIVEGWFTGKVRVFDAYSGFNRREFKAGKDEGLHEVAELKVLRLRDPRFVQGEALGEDDHASLVLDAASFAAQVPRLGDARRWLVIAASIPLHEVDARRQAEAVKARLLKAGFPDAELVDSRQAPLIFCCHLLVVAGRTASRAEADALVFRAKKASLVTYPRQGW